MLKGVLGVAASAWKYPYSVHTRYHFASTEEGSYALGSSLILDSFFRL